MKTLAIVLGLLESTDGSKNPLLELYTVASVIYLLSCVLNLDLVSILGTSVVIDIRRVHLVHGRKCAHILQEKKYLYKNLRMLH